MDISDVDESDAEAFANSRRSDVARRGSCLGPAVTGLRGVRAGSPDFKRPPFLPPVPAPSSAELSCGLAFPVMTAVLRPAPGQLDVSAHLQRAPAYSCLRFFSAFKLQIDNEGVPEAAAVKIWALVSVWRSIGFFNQQTENNDAEIGGFSTWPEAVQFFLRAYATDDHMEDAVERLPHGSEGR